MKDSIWFFWEGKVIYVLLKNNIVYSGKCLEVVDTGNGLFFITMIDRLGNHVCIANHEIKVIKEMKGDSEQD